MTLTLIFILLTFPGAIVSGYFYFELSQTKLGYTLLLLCDNITFSYHSLNFFVVVFTNKKFYNEFKYLFPKITIKFNKSNNSNAINSNNAHYNTRNNKNTFSNTNVRY